MRAPFDRVAAGDRGRVLLLLSASAILMLALLGMLDMPLKNETSPQGILSLQLAFDPTTALSMLNHWNDDQRLLCAFGLGLDYLFMFLYPAATAAGCVFFGERLRFHGATLGKLAPLFAWAAVAAGVADMIENALTLGVLRGVADLAVGVAVAAVVKFALLLTGLVYAVVAGVRVRLYARAR